MLNWGPGEPNKRTKKTTGLARKFGGSWPSFSAAVAL
jgi:hypothetical protein